MCERTIFTILSVAVYVDRFTYFCFKLYVKVLKDVCLTEGPCTVMAHHDRASTQDQFWDMDHHLEQRYKKVIRGKSKSYLQAQVKKAILVRDILIT